MNRHIAFICMGLFISSCYDLLIKAPEDAGPSGGSGDAGGSYGSGDGHKGHESIGDTGAADGGDAGDAAVPNSGEANCGNGIIEKNLNEVCDDGNLNDDDGCTSLCEYSCLSDDNCDDSNPCDGAETCNDKHYCDLGPYMKDGESCSEDNMKSCFSGFCLYNVCGDATKQNDETCDDGDTNEDNGCTTKCKWSCATDKDCPAKDTCAGTAKCDTTRHTCSGTDAPDETPCKIVGSGADGWCQSGVCVPPDCGDGDKVSPEECDLGDQNGKAGSGCSIDCKVEVCGNSKIEGKEECDDGNRQDLDTCGSDCKVELWYRFTNMSVLKEVASEWCAPEIQGKNRFGEAFPGTKLIPAMGETDVLSIVNNMLNQATSYCTSNALNRVVGSSDPSFRTTDSDISVYVYDGQLEAGQICSDPLIVDSRFGITPGTEADPYLAIIPAAQRPGMIWSTKSANVTLMVPGIGRVKMYYLKALIPVDTSVLSTPAPLPDLIDTVRLPERFGFNDPDTTPYEPLGRICAAVQEKSMSQQPLDSASHFVDCCKTAGGAYRECKQGNVPGEDCDTFLDVLKQGCVICISDLGNCDPSCAITLEVVRPVEPDIDTNNDGTPDAYSAVIGVEGVRVRVTRVK